MNATFTCPHCHRESDYEDIQMDADLLAIIKMQPVFGRHHNLVWAYCELFGIAPLKTRRKKLRLLLEELKTLFQAGEFPYQKKRYPISQAGIAEALNIAAKKNFTAPLENHNYLKKIMITIAEREGKGAGIAAEKDLRQREARLQAGDREELGTDFKPVPRVKDNGNPGAYEEPPEHVLPPLRSMPAAELTEEQLTRNKARVRDILKGIGG